MEFDRRDCVGKIIAETLHNEALVPALEEINLDPQLRGSEITEEEFATAWLE